MATVYEAPEIDKSFELFLQERDNAREQARQELSRLFTAFNERRDQLQEQARSLEDEMIGGERNFGRRLLARFAAHRARDKATREATAAYERHAKALEHEYNLRRPAQATSQDFEDYAMAVTDARDRDTLDPILVAFPGTRKTSDNGWTVYARDHSLFGKREIARVLGEQVVIRGHKHDSVRAAILIAKERCTPPLSFNGSPEFVEAAQRIAHDLGIDVTGRTPTANEVRGQGAPAAGAAGPGVGGDGAAAPGAQGAGEEQTAGAFERAGSLRKLTLEEFLDKAGITGEAREQRIVDAKTAGIVDSVMKRNEWTDAFLKINENRTTPQSASGERTDFVPCIFDEIEELAEELGQDVSGQLEDIRAADTSTQFASLKNLYDALKAERDQTQPEDGMGPLRAEYPAAIDLAEPADVTAVGGAVLALFGQGVGRAAAIDVDGERVLGIRVGDEIDVAVGDAVRGTVSPNGNDLTFTRTGREGPDVAHHPGRGGRK